VPVEWRATGGRRVRRLVDDEQVVVLVDDAQNDVRLGLEASGVASHQEPQVGAGADDRVERRGAPSNPSGGGGDELLDVAPREPVASVT